VLNNPITCQGEHKMHLILCRLNPSHASKDTKCISSFVEQTHPMPARTQNVSQHVLNNPITCQGEHKMHLILCRLNPSHASKDIKCISRFVEQTHPMPAMTKNSLSIPSHANQDTKCIPTSVEQTPSHASEDREFISTCVYQSHPKPARTQKVSLYVLTQPSHDRENSKCNTTCVDQTPPLPASSQNAYQHGLTKLLACQ